THGHFAQMGGFERLDNRRVLYPPTLIALLEKGQLDVAELKRVTDRRINDHSKGDILSKGIVALQTTWFVFECLARLHQGLPLLELEVVTLAFAVLNTLTYAFWWHKPLNVLCPIHLHILPKALNAPPSVSESTETSGKPPPTSAESQPSDQAVDEDATHVSTFYGMEISEGKDLLVGLLSCFIGMIFGAIHVLSWHSAFPTRIQLLLWRISSIVLVAEPFCLAFESVLGYSTGGEPSFDTWREAVVSTLGIFFALPSMILGPLFYILARMCLLVLAFLTLHNPPSTALQTISWTTYIPHL
ncbi:hypothetical protein BDN72DRAFT_779268, partial [Pluteus cervinus]